MVKTAPQVVSSSLELDNFLICVEAAVSKDSNLFGNRSRAEKLLNGLTKLEIKRDEINELVALETGKSMQLCNSEFDSAIQYSRMLCYGTLGESGQLTTSKSEEKRVELRSTPYGAALLITSYNTPLPNLFWKVAPSFLAGNFSLLCPSPHVFASAKKVVDTLYESGISNVEIAISNGDPKVAEIACRRSEFRLVSFTGSVEVGKKVSSNCAPNYPKIILELGGVNPTIIGSTSKILEASRAAMTSAFSNGGQRCAAGSIVICTEDLYSEFEDCIKELSQDTQFRNEIIEINTPLINEHSRSKHFNYLDLLKREGASVTELYNFNKAQAISPALVRHIPAHSSSSFEEVFSPILKIFKARNTIEAIDFANKSPLRLTAALWTESLEESVYAQEALRFGLVNINGFTFGSEPNFPFGGLGLSGNGSRDAGFSALREYSQTTVRTVRI